jgi:plasmid maintenance system antidote protein VapI
MRFERVNIGEIVRKKVQENKITFSSFAKSIGIQRQNIEKTIFGKRSLDTEILIRISETLDFDFFQYYRNMDECNKNDYKPNELTEVKALLTLQVGTEKKEEKFTFLLRRNDEGLKID